MSGRALCVEAGEGRTASLSCSKDVPVPSQRKSANIEPLCAPRDSASGPMASGAQGESEACNSRESENGNWFTHSASVY